MPNLLGHRLLRLRSAQQANPIKVWVNYDGDGNETLNPNTEWVRIQNQGSTALSLTGWWLRSAAAQDYLRFPAGTAIKAHSILTRVRRQGDAYRHHAATGAARRRTSRTPTSPGRTAAAPTSSTPRVTSGRTRAFRVSDACSDSRAGQVTMTVNYDAPGDDQTNPNGE